MKILITGSNGLLGQKLVHQLRQDDTVDLIATARGANRLNHQEGYQYYSMDISNLDEVLSVFEQEKPDVVIHSAAMTHVDQCEDDKEGCLKLNVEAVQYIIAACSKHKAHLVHLSTDFIFDGSEASWKKGGKFLKNRQIELSGEAFFEVEEGNQFLVNTDLGQVEVLGTSFNVLSRDNIFSVQCATGRVRVRLKNGQSQILSPGEGVFMNSTGSLVFEEINEQTKIGSWRQNKHLYSNISYKDLIAELERQFGIEIFVDHELENRYGNFYFSSANIDSALYQITWPLDALYEQRSEDQYRIYLKK